MSNKIAMKVWSRGYNPHIPNIDAISGALFTVRIQYEKLNVMRDGIDTWYMGIIKMQPVMFPNGTKITYLVPFLFSGPGIQEILVK